MRAALSLLLVLSYLTMNAQSVIAQYHPFKGYIPSGYTILGRAAADINGDGHTDVVAVLQNPYD